MTTKRAWTIGALVALACGAVVYAQGVRVEPGSLRVVGNLGVGAGPSARVITTAGAGEASGVSDAGGKAATILATSTGGGGGDGGAVEFGFGYPTFARYFAAIKGNGLDGSANTRGDLVFYTRASTAATSLTEQARFTESAFSLVSAFRVTSSATAATLAIGNNNNLDPGGRVVVQYGAPTADGDITGIAGGVDGRLLLVGQFSSLGGDVRFLRENAASTAANRITGAGTVTLTDGRMVLLIYDGSLQRWRLYSLF